MIQTETQPRTCKFFKLKARFKTIDYLFFRSFIAVHGLPQKDFISNWDIIESSAEDEW
jgi:hypothetical protein